MLADQDSEQDTRGRYYNWIDYTPPEYISELFTDIGIFTPAAVSDEIIKYF